MDETGHIARPPTEGASLRERPEWLSPKDLEECFGIGRTKAWELCKALPHVYVGRSIRVHRDTLVKELREHGRI